MGETAGGGRFTAHGARVPSQAIYLYTLARDWRAQLGPGEGLARDEWAENKFGETTAGDLRWSKRLVISAQVQAEQPMASFLAAAQGGRAAVNRHYFAIDQPADAQVTPENILAPHRRRTLRRIQGHEVVLCIQDGTDLNFAEHPGYAGLKLIGKKRHAKGTLGLHMHSTLSVSGEGIPL